MGGGVEVVDRDVVGHLGRDDGLVLGQFGAGGAQVRSLDRPRAALGRGRTRVPSEDLIWSRVSGPAR